VPQRPQIRDRGKSSTCLLLNLRGFHREIFVNLKNKVILEQWRKMNGVLCYTAGRTEPLCFDFFSSHWPSGYTGLLVRKGGGSRKWLCKVILQHCTETLFNSGLSLHCSDTSGSPLAT